MSNTNTAQPCSLDKLNDINDNNNRHHTTNIQDINTIISNYINDITYDKKTHTSSNTFETYDSQEISKHVLNNNPDINAELNNLNLNKLNTINNRGNLCNL